MVRYPAWLSHELTVPLGSHTPPWASVPHLESDIVTEGPSRGCPLPLLARAHLAALETGSDLSFWGMYAWLYRGTSWGGPISPARPRQLLSLLPPQGHLQVAVLSQRPDSPNMFLPERVLFSLPWAHARSLPSSTSPQTMFPAPFINWHLSRSPIRGVGLDVLGCFQGWLVTVLVKLQARSLPSPCSEAWPGALGWGAG